MIQPKFKQVNRNEFDSFMQKFSKSELTNERIRICEPEIIEIFRHGALIARIVDNSPYDQADEFFIVEGNE